MDIQSYRLYSAAQVRAFDRIAIASHGISGLLLMERAGQVIFDAIKQHWPTVRQVSIACGSGNNGGDGYSIARLLHKAGVRVHVVSLSPKNSLKGEAKQAFQKAVDAGIKVQKAGRIVNKNTELVVDALLGTGLSRSVEGTYQQAIEEMNYARVPVLSVDIPSGLHADTGCPLGLAVKAEVTTTFVAQKKGLFTGDAGDYCGKIIFNRLALADAVYAEEKASGYRLDEDVLNFNMLPKRDCNSHKGSYGHVLIIGGNYGMSGSVRLAAEAALRVGAGKVTVATRKENVEAVMAGLPEVMCHGVETSAELKKVLPDATVIIIGPGLGKDVWSKGVFKCTMKYSTVPTLIDADGLNLLAEIAVANKKMATLLTPHPGEASALLASTTKTIQQDRFMALQALHEKYGGCILLKGAGSLMTNGDETSVCDTGNPGMASAGMGDLLSGVIAGLLAQGCNRWQAMQLGTLIHAVSGDRVRAVTGEKGMLASDLLPVIRALINQVSDAGVIST